MKTGVSVVKRRNRRPKRNDMYSEQKSTIGWVTSIFSGRVMPFNKMFFGVSAAAGLSLFITFCSSGRWSSARRRAALRFRSTLNVSAVPLRPRKPSKILTSD